MGVSRAPTKAPCPVAELLPEDQLQLLQVLRMGAILVAVKDDRLLMPRSTKCSGTGRDRLWHMRAEDALGGKSFPLWEYQGLNPGLPLSSPVRTQPLHLYSSLQGSLLNTGCFGKIFAYLSPTSIKSF